MAFFSHDSQKYKINTSASWKDRNRTGAEVGHLTPASKASKTQDKKSSKNTKSK